MKVKELIAALQEYDEDMEVVVPDRQTYGYFSKLDISIQNMEHVGDSAYEEYYSEGPLDITVVIE